MTYWLFTKSSVWSYEQEVRAVMMENNGVITYNKECLQEIHFGVNAKPSTIASVKAIVESKNYDLQRISIMEMDRKTFGLKEKDLLL